MDLLLNAYTLKRLLYLVSITLLVFYGLTVFDNPHHIWLVWSAYALSLLVRGDTFWQRVTLIFLTGYLASLAALASGVLVASTWGHYWGEYTYLFVLVTLATLISLYYPRYLLSLFIISLFAILGSTNEPSANFIMLGMLMVLLLQVIFWPNFAANEMKLATVRALHHLKALNSEIFACFLQSDYRANIYLYERRLHIQKTAFLNWLQRLRNLQDTRQKEASQKEPGLIKKLDELYAITLDYSQLRLRVTDHTTFGVCQKELEELTSALNKVYISMMVYALRTQFENDLNILMQKINRLEENYQNVIQVAAPEPLVFLLFLSSMKMLHKALSEFYS